MECVEAKALKTSLWTEMGGLRSSSQQAFTEEYLLSGGGITNCGFGDHDSSSFVDDFLDFSKQEVAEEEEDTVSVSSQDQDVSVKEAFESSLPESELCVPGDDLASLEWLSHFVEDSFSGFSSPFPSTNPKPIEKKVEVSPLKISIFPTPVPAKARSKRSRATGRVWSSLGSPSFSEASSSSSSSSNSSCLIFPNTTQNLDLLYYFRDGERLPAKKQRKNNNKTPLTELRRCSHCGVQKTPQWRTGPLGAKTLCNACGVRFKSGRLLPEYRPACSPTFSSEVHSNNHRKVLEMRRKKEIGPTSSGLVHQAVSSF